ncbi:hypothetical protein PanWU01x14_017990 [Parasponia andersonii]|uniref:Uncharacterized protein n=1 Tax=Parasponia andersonii TaxID=3476 RepID=A0A2P5DZ11_PARAD|nr:hypothetical protein PanWU01x14_017990 [Parasponia andersonii]
MTLQMPICNKVDQMLRSFWWGRNCRGNLKLYLKPWSKLCSPKSVLKSKYLRQNSFLLAKSSLYAYWTWKNLCKAKSLLTKAACRFIGDGRSTII